MSRPIVLVFSLFFLSPLVAEYLLGNMAIDALPALLFLAPMCGGGAVLVRESARQAGRGWPTMLLLAFAYALVEEGLATQTLFNPSYFGIQLLRETYIPALGMGAWWTLFVLALHTVWSISAPIAIIEAFASDRTRPWLGRRGLAVVSVVFVLGAGLVAFWTYQQEHFVAAPSQLAGVAVSVLVVSVAAFSVEATRPRGKRAVPEPWLVGVVSFVAASSIFVLRSAIGGWPLVAAYLLIFASVAVAVTRWTCRSGWSPLHIVSLAAGALLTYAWHSFPETPVIGSKGTIDLLGNVVFSLGACATPGGSHPLRGSSPERGSGRDRWPELASRPRLVRSSPLSTRVPP